MKNISQSVASHSERFLQNISKALPDEVNEFSLEWFGIKLASGRGQYRYVMECEVNGAQIKIHLHTTDSVEFDTYMDFKYESRGFDNWIKRKVLWILNKESIKDEIFELINEED